MKKIFAIVAVFLIIVSLASVGLAKTQHQNIILNRIVVIEDVAEIRTSVVVKNDRDFDFNGGKVIVSIPELGLRTSTRLDPHHNSRRTARLLLDIPDYVPRGEYYIRIVVSNEDVKRVRHRLITIE